MFSREHGQERFLIEVYVDIIQLLSGLYSKMELN
jgi:hypothetical protein